MGLTFTWTTTIGGVNVSHLVKEGGTIDYGRPTVATAYQAPQAVFDMQTEVDYPNYTGTFPTIEEDDPVTIDVSRDGGVTTVRRFTGKVQALSWGPNGMRVTCAGESVDWQTRIAGETGSIYPITPQLETDRVTYYADDAGVSITIEGVSSRRLREIPKNTPDQVLLDALLSIAENCDGLLFEDRTGQVRYRTRNFNRPNALEIPGNVIDFESLDMVRERGALCNAVRVYYGEPDPVTGLQSYVYADDSSGANTIASIGPRVEQIVTDIQYAAGATGRAQVYLERNRLAHHVPDAVILMHKVTGTMCDDLWDLEENWPVQLQDIPDGYPVSTYDGDLLGVTELMFKGDYRMMLHLGPVMADTASAPETEIFPEDSITGGTTSTYEDDDGRLWQLHEWETPGSYTFTVNNDVTAECVAVAGGGKGGNDGPGVGGGGAGAGGLFAGEIALTPGSVAVTVGAAAADTTLAGLTLHAGGNGGNAGNAGSSGGSGGGAGGNTIASGGNATKGTGGAPLFGSNGGGSGFTVSGHVGGGASGTGQAGYTSDITGTSVEYGRGGGVANGGNVYPTPGSGSDGRDYLQAAAVDGMPGAVCLRYRIG